MFAYAGTSRKAIYWCIYIPYNLYLVILILQKYEAMLGVKYDIYYCQSL